MQSTSGRVVILGTGGTIAGTAASAADHVGYSAAQLGVAQLLQAVPPLAGLALEAEQVAQLDSKDMDHATWLHLAQRVAHHLAREDVAGMVVTHGTDTLEETAYFLQRVLAPRKPVVLTAAMRPATALSADGPQNLLDAVTVALSSEARGVLVAFGGELFSGLELRKRHSYKVAAFDAGDAGPVALLLDGRLRSLRAWPAGEPLGTDVLPKDASHWPKVVVWPSHAGIDGSLALSMVDTLHAAGVRGLVLAGTGNGTLHQALEPALHKAQAQGIRVWRSSRCASGGVVGEGAWPSAGPLTPWQARIELMLQLVNEASNAR
jgi:L-asparaginase